MTLREPVSSTTLTYPTLLAAYMTLDTHPVVYELLTPVTDETDGPVSFYIYGPRSAVAHLNRLADGMEDPHLPWG